MLFRRDFRYHSALLKLKQIPVSKSFIFFFQLLITFLFSDHSSQGGDAGEIGSCQISFGCFKRNFIQNVLGIALQIKRKKKRKKTTKHNISTNTI